MKKKRSESIYKLDEQGIPESFVKDFPTKKQAEQFIENELSDRFGTYAIITTFR